MKKSANSSIFQSSFIQHFFFLPLFIQNLLQHHLPLQLSICEATGHVIPRNHQFSTFSFVCTFNTSFIHVLPKEETTNLSLQHFSLLRSCCAGWFHSCITFFFSFLKNFLFVQITEKTMCWWLECTTSTLFLFNMLRCKGISMDFQGLVAFGWCEMHCLHISANHKLKTCFHPA